MPQVSRLCEEWQDVWYQAARTLRNGDDVSELQVPDREVDNGGVLLPEEVVLGEALEVQHQIGRQARQAVPSPAILDVIVHLAPVKFVQQLKDGNLQMQKKSGPICGWPRIAQGSCVSRVDQPADFEIVVHFAPISL